MAHQKAVARIGRRAGIDRARHTVEGRQSKSIAAVRHIEQQAVIAALGIFRRQDADIRAEMHQAIAAACRQVDIGDAAVQRVRRVHREVCFAIELNVAPDTPKRPSAGQRLAGLDLKLGNGHCAPPSVDLAPATRRGIVSRYQLADLRRYA
jgi:hypothetical protein